MDSMLEHEDAIRLRIDMDVVFVVGHDTRDNLVVFVIDVDAYSVAVTKLDGLSQPACGDSSCRRQKIERNLVLPIGSHWS